MWSAATAQSGARPDGALAESPSVIPHSEMLLPAFSSFCFLPLVLPPKPSAITRLLLSLQQNQHDASEHLPGQGGFL